MKSGKKESVAFATAWAALDRAGYQRDPKSGKYELEKSRKDTLKDKVDEYNEKYGEKHGRVTVSMLEDVYDRGIGAYRTNPESVRPNVKSKEQWAFARVNSFLDAARGSKEINHDQDIHDKIKKSQPTPSDVHVPSTGRKEIDKDEDSFKPPAGVRAAARRALRWREKYPGEAKGGTRVGWERANQLANGENLSRETVARMASFFARHEGNEEVSAENKEKPWRDRGRLMWEAWGGDAGREWSRRIADGFKKSVDLGPLTLKSGVSSNRVEHPRDVLSSADDDLGPSVAVFSLKADVTSVSKNAELLGAPFFCADAGSDAESLLIMPLSKVSVPVEPSSDEMWNEASGDFWGDEVVCLVREGTPSSQVLDKMFGANSNRSIRRFCFSGSGQDSHGTAAPNTISKILHMLNIRGGDAKPIAATCVGDTSVSKDKASPVSDFCGVPLEKIFVPHDGVSGAFADRPVAMLSHDTLIFNHSGYTGSPDFEKSGYGNAPHTSSVEVKDFLLIIGDVIGHDACPTRGGGSSQAKKRQIANDKMDSLEKRESGSEDEGLLDRAVSAIIKAVMQQVPVNKSVSDAEIIKMDDEQRVVYGWASVVTEDDQPVVDTQGDVISPSEMEKMANDFMLDVRKAKAMHEGDQVGEVIHSMPLTKELMKAFDIFSDKEGWMVGFKIYDDDTWEDVKNGRFSGLSIGGKGSYE
jgi:hypothetical protein